MLVMLKTKEGGSQDISILNADIEMSGDLRKVSRDLTLTITRKGVDYYMPAFTGDRGDSIAIYSDEGELLYRGVIWEIDIDSSGTDIDLLCFDALIFLNKSESKDSVFTEKTAEEVAEQVISEFGLTVGKLAHTGHEVRLNGRGKTGYEIIMSAYTEAARANGKVYYPILRYDHVDIIEKGEEIEGLVIEHKGEGLPGHLISLKYSESSEEMVNKIITVDGTGNIISEETNESDIEKYGMVQKVAQNASDTEAKVKEDLKLNSGKKTVSLECIGDWRLRTGWSVRVRSEELGFDEVLYIENDRHHVTNGLHFTTLELSYENIMDEHEMKEEKREGGLFGEGGYIEGDSNEIKIWNYLRAKGFTKAAVAAILGNMWQETGGTFNPAIIEGGNGIGYGLMQWSFSRRTDLMNWASANGRDPANIETQLDFMIHELESGYPGLLEELKNISDPKLATDKFHDIFVRSNDKNANWGGMQNRYNEAQNYFNSFGSREISPGNLGGHTGVVAEALKYVGTWYVWSGSTPASGFDCSGLVQWAYAQNGISIPRTTYDQLNIGRNVRGQPLEPGDLLFPYNGHVGMYIGNGQVVHSPQTGEQVRVENAGPYWLNSPWQRRVL